MCLKSHTGSLIPPPHTGIEGAVKPVSLLIWISNLAQPCLLSAPQHHLQHLFESQLFKLTGTHSSTGSVVPRPDLSVVFLTDFMALSCPDKLHFILWLSFLHFNQKRRKTKTLIVTDTSLKEALEAERQAQGKKNGYSKRNARQANQKYQRYEAKGRNSGQVQNEKKGEVSLPIDFHWWTMKNS